MKMIIFANSIKRNWYSRAEKATPYEPSTWCCCCGDAEDVVDLVDDHVPDGVYQQVLQQPPVHHLQLPALLINLGGGGAGQSGAEKEADNQHGPDHVKSLSELD